MVYYVYLIKTVKGFLNKSYVGYTNNFNKDWTVIIKIKVQNQQKVINGNLFIRKGFIKKIKHFHLNMCLKKIEKKELNC